MRVSSWFYQAYVSVFLGGAAVIAGALLFQYVGGLQPCELCLDERWPYYIGVPLTLAALLAGRWRPLLIGGAVIVLLIYLASSALAFYHVGVEQHWFAGPTACTGGGGTAHTIAELEAQLSAAQPVRCDEPQWTMVGISLAGWNLLASLALAALSASGLHGALKGEGA
ncbi:MAG TPA: disulfide bond formation protein B [Stellaceae bacterium]|nr:disulfide bond formation protein B [Stellaceae bacterium]